MYHRGRKNGDAEHWVFAKYRGVSRCDIPPIRGGYLISTRDIEMQRAIMGAQLEQEQLARSVAASSAVRLILSDRSAIDPIAYVVLTAINEEDARKRMHVLVDTVEFQAALYRYREGTFILFKPVPEWLVDDGVRSVESQGQTLEVFRKVLEELDVPYVELGEETKDLQARVTFARGLINQVVRMGFFLLENPVVYSYFSP